MCSERYGMGPEPAAGAGPGGSQEAAGEMFRLPWDPEWWRCLRFGGISGRYECVQSGKLLLPMGLDLRVDVDRRYANSPVMDKVSGDFYRTQWTFGDRGFGPARLVRVYQASWIIDSPTVRWSRCSCVITGSVRYWKGLHLLTQAEIVIDWGGGTTEATARFTTAGSTTTYAGPRASDAFRAMNLEVDVCSSVNANPILPSCDTHWHPTRPADLPQRVLTVEECYREAGVAVTIRPDRTIVDDSAAQFSTWSVGELHDAMETHFSQIGGTWPRWEMWGLLVGRFDSSGLAGIMFDAAAAYGGAGEAPDRQGFAVARNHEWFDDLVDGAPANDAQAAAMRQFLYTWVHEAGHAFNFLHSWNKGRADSLSWMNYPHYVTDFWNNFRMRFDDEELVHIRHGDRSSVIMGADDWASGGHLESSGLESMSAALGDPELEVLLRSKPYFDFLEPVEVEVRLRNLLPDRPMDVDVRLQPEHGRVAFLVQRPDGRLLDHESIFCKVGQPEVRTLKGSEAGGEGEDRYSESVVLSYAKHGFLFAEPGEYRVRAYYQLPSGFVYPSNVLRLRVGRPFSREEDRLAQDYFSKAVGLILALGELRSPYLESGRNVLENAVDRLGESPAAARIGTLMAQALTRPFHRVVEGKKKEDLKVKRAAKAEPERAVELTEPAVKLYRKETSKWGNLGYHRVVRLRAEALKEMGDAAKAKEEVKRLRSDLAKRDVHPPVLDAISAFGKSL